MKKLATVSLSAIAVLGLSATGALAGHNTPSKTAEYKMPLVRDYPKCTAPNDTKPPPVGILGGVCSTPGTHAATSAYSYGPKGTGTLSLKWAKTNKKDYNANTTADSPADADVIIKLSLVDFRNPANVPYSGAAVGNGVAKLRITDTYTGSGDSGTQEDIPFPIPAPPGQGCSNGKCTITTSADAAYAGAVQTGKKANIQVGVGYGESFFPPGTYPDPWVKIADPTGATFATPGIYLP